MPGGILARRDRSRRARSRHSAKPSALLTLALILLSLGALGAGARVGSYLVDEFLRLRAAAVYGPDAASYPAAAARVKAHPPGRVAASVPRFDEFAVRAIVNQVPAPPGTGLPGTESVIIDPESMVPLTFNLRVAGVDNAAWN